MTITRGLMSSDRGDWETPPEVFLDIEEWYGPFDLDVCALPETAKVSRYFTPEDDGLAQEWRGACYMNPPYGREIPKWVAKARHEAEAGRATVVALLPARTDTRCWHEHVLRADEIVFLRGRVRFLKDGLPGGPAPFPSAVVIWRAA